MVLVFVGGEFYDFARVLTTGRVGLDLKYKAQNSLFGQGGRVVEKLEYTV